MQKSMQAAVRRFVNSNWRLRVLAASPTQAIIQHVPFVLLLAYVDEITRYRSYLRDGFIISSAMYSVN